MRARSSIALLVAAIAACARTEPSGIARDPVGNPPVGVGNAASTPAPQTYEVDGVLLCTRGPDPKEPCAGEFPDACIAKIKSAFDLETLQRTVWRDGKPHPTPPYVPELPDAAARCYASGPHLAFNLVRWCCRPP